MQLHRIAVNLYGCNSRIGSAPLIDASLREALKVAGFKILGETIINFQPHGTTVVFVLAESHAVVSTWPEANFVSLDLGLCAKAETGEAIVEALVQLLTPVHVTKESSTTSMDVRNIPLQATSAVS